MAHWMVLILASSAVLLFLSARRSEAHCDTLEGPVISDAVKAFERMSPDVVLKWIRQEDEDEIREAFEKALKVSDLGEEPREMARMWFFETLVRVHRAGEGAPYEGLQPSDSVPPVVKLADEALEKGDVRELAERISAHVKDSVIERFEHARSLKAEACRSPEAGRKYVKAYVDYVHYVEGIHAMTMGEGHGDANSRHHC
ncbi:MAG: DUF6448 family protein [Thermovirgaceae bacterium]